ncbi:uncharacterized protein SETTUDRAFT_100801 [Exserohilum turcica Et28A]|uniref:BZIP domain-containing protein n=1 Tax=Exserohilum turcicum (strain 28A) TaxID=671987 RepID=R0JXA5_EXST2|nr:uncharacterized protein SETTUDRAFT_100801 [Exserohilum turcica Et28A]EOA80907.1 hypothetical protein SETTUDRAFT_100801 [Exserohilum turcica Et28A]
MCQNQQSNLQQAESPTQEQSVTGEQASEANKDDWADVSDPSERRKIQNKLAQRRFRDRIKEQREEAERELENIRRAGGSYAPPEPESIDTSQTLSGLPWGGISMRHVIEQGKNRQQSLQNNIRGGCTDLTEHLKEDKNSR